MSPGLRFTKKQRLLDSGEFQAVFGDARLKVSCRTLLVLARHNESQHARIGLVVGKKHLKTAVQRNRIKRQVRESFRHIQQELTGLDIIVLVRHGTIGEQDNQQVRESIDRLWQDLIRRQRGQRTNTGKQ